jgi:hypothetical protein
MCQYITLCRRHGGKPPAWMLLCKGRCLAQLGELEAAATLAALAVALPQPHLGGLSVEDGIIFALLSDPASCLRRWEAAAALKAKGNDAFRWVFPPPLLAATHRLTHISGHGDVRGRRQRHIETRHSSFPLLSLSLSPPLCLSLCVCVCRMNGTVSQSLLIIISGWTGQRTSQEQRRHTRPH